MVVALPFLGLLINKKEKWHKETGEEDLIYYNDYIRLDQRRKGTKPKSKWGVSNDIVAKRWSEVVHKEAQQRCYFEVFIK